MDILIDPYSINKICGAVWASQSLATGFNRTAIAGKGGRLVIGSVVGSVARAEYSDDGGATWTARTVDPFAAGYPAMVAANSTDFVAYINAISFAFSSDGDTWGLIATPSTIGSVSPVFGFGKWFVFSDATNNYYTVTISGGVATPSAALGGPGTHPVGAGNLAGAFGAGRMVTTGRQGVLSVPVSAYSTDGLTFVQSASLPPFAIPRLAFGAGLFVGIGESPTATTDYLYTVDGNSWTLGTLPLARRWREVIFLPCGFLVSCSDGPELLTSPDGLVWYVLPASHHFAAIGAYDRIASDGMGRFAALERGINKALQIGA
jgi:hypothetical protein